MNASSFLRLGAVSVVLLSCADDPSMLGNGAPIVFDAGPGAAPTVDAGGMRPPLSGGGAMGGTMFDAGSGGVSMAPSTICETRTVDAQGTLPDMLVVLDRSLSMTLFLRWEPSRQAVKTITNDYGGLIRFGLSSFPADTDPCAPGPVEVPVAQGNGGAIGRRLDQLGTTGFTPTGAALTEALKTLGARTPGLDTATRPAYVLLVTDGEPSCAVIPGIPDPGQQDAAKAAVRLLKDANIPTYVIGYQIDPAFQSLMNELAQLGGTGTYRPAESSEQVVATFRQITKDIVKCSFDLAEVPSDPRFVRVTIDQRTIALNAADGWVINGQTVSLQGAACEGLRDGKGHVLNAQVECKPIELQ